MDTVDITKRLRGVFGRRNASNVPATPIHKPSTEPAPTSQERVTLVGEFIRTCRERTEFDPAYVLHDAVPLSSDVKEQAVSGLSADQRLELFRDCIDELSALGVDAHVGMKHEDDDPNRLYSGELQAVRQKLIEKGFTITPCVLHVVLRICAAGNPFWAMNYGLGSHSKMGVLHSIKLAADAGLSLDDDAVQILRQMHTSLVKQNSTYLKSSRVRCRQHIEQIEDLLGITNPALIERLMSLPQRQPLKDVKFCEEPNERELAFDKALDIHAELRSDVLRAYGSEPMLAPWMTDRTVFEERFGRKPIFPDRGGFKFWENEHWVTERDGVVTDQRHFSATRERGDEDLLTTSLTAKWREQRARLAERTPYLWNGKGLPGVEYFKFDGVDENGDFLEHFATARSSKPSKAWLKTASNLSETIGKANVRQILIDWLELLSPLTGLEATLEDYKFLARYELLADRWNHIDDEEKNVSRWGPLSRDVRINRQALVMLQGARGHVRYVREFQATTSGSTFQIERNLRQPLSDLNNEIVRGVIWTLAQWSDGVVVQCLERTALTLLSKSFGEFRSLIGANACVWSLGAIGTRDAVFALGRIRRSIKDKNVAKQVGKALVAAGKKVGLTGDDMEEISVPHYELNSATNQRVESVGDYDFVLEITQSNKARAFAIGPKSGKSKEHRSIPKAALETLEARELADELKRAAKDICKVLPEVRRRVEQTYRTGRTWAYTDWIERYRDHGLSGWITRRTIWCFEQPDGTTFVALSSEDGLIDVTGGNVAEPCSETRVSVWHPLHATTEEIVGWRQLLIDRELRQPLMQAWRPLYVVTDAERSTETYSNRFAGHILMQAPVIAMARHWNWTARARVPNDRESEEPMRLKLPHFGVMAEFWASGTGPVTSNEYAFAFGHLATDRLQFHALDSQSGEASARPMSIAEVPPLALCEVMRDIDVIVGVTSLGADRNWGDRGQRASLPSSDVPDFERYRSSYDERTQGEMLRTSRAFLEMVLPKLEIANNCHLTERHLVVDGRNRSYKIHLGSGNVLMLPDNRYLCIVPSGGHVTDRLLPFEGDDTMSTILSKAYLLIDDHKIKDKTILSQIG